MRPRGVRGGDACQCGSAIVRCPAPVCARHARSADGRVSGAGRGKRGTRGVAARGIAASSGVKEYIAFTLMCAAVSQ